MTTAKYVGLTGKRNPPAEHYIAPGEVGDQSEKDETWGTQEDGEYWQVTTAEYVGLTGTSDPPVEHHIVPGKVGDQSK